MAAYIEAKDTGFKLSAKDATIEMTDQTTGEKALGKVLLHAEITLPQTLLSTFSALYLCSAALVQAAEGVNGGTLLCADWEKWIVTTDDSGTTTLKGRSGDHGYLSVKEDGTITYVDVRAYCTKFPLSMPLIRELHAKSP